MKKNPITFREKVQARYIPRGRSQCWMWDGSLAHGRPAVNLRHVIRFIYQWERGPIPPGHTLHRRDHVLECKELHYECRHRVCVNPWHVEPVANRQGLYMRENNWDGTDTEHTLRYKNTQRNEKKNGRDRDSQGGGADPTAGPGEGTGMA